jgi:nicotinamidase/pyrazinamidase
MAIRKALIVVHVQPDFCDGGTFPATDTASLIGPLERCIVAARRAGAVIVFSQDWHPPDHLSFQSNGGPWPTHCVAGSSGAELMPPLVPQEADVAVQSGAARDALGYSIFEFTQLADRLRKLGGKSAGVCGIATEYCVRATALDAQRGGWSTTVLADLIRSIDPRSAAQVLEELAHEGIEVGNSERG